MTIESMAEEYRKLTYSYFEKYADESFTAGQAASAECRGYERGLEAGAKAQAALSAEQIHVANLAFEKQVATTERLLASKDEQCRDYEMALKNIDSHQNCRDSFDICRQALEKWSK